jgi:membrane protease YdiL (CAAX protease family)
VLEGWFNADILGLRWFPVFAVWIIAQSVVMAVAYYATGRSILTAIVIHLLANTTNALLNLSATEFAVMAAAWAVGAIGVATWNAHRSTQTALASLP